MKKYTAKDSISLTDFKLNTVVTITVYDSHKEKLLEQAMELCDYYESLFSRTFSSSELYQLNHKTLPSKDGFYNISPDTANVIQKGLEYSRLSSGAFDISIEPVSSLWDFTSKEHYLPSPIDIKRALPLVNYENITLKNNQVHFANENMGLDLGAIAKGYIADKIKEFLMNNGVTSGIINLGGNVLCIGKRPDGHPFSVGIQDPFQERNETILQIPVTDQSLVSSGVYERSFEKDGVLYHHILDPKTGYPFHNGLVSVTILSNASVDGDGLSTTCFSLGLKKGMELINSIPNVEALFITEDHTLHYSDHFPH